MSEENIVRCSLADAGNGRTDWDRVLNMTEEEIEANALSDPDNPPLTDEELAAMVPMIPGELRKEPVSIRLDPEVLEFFRRDGPGYQSRINAVLRGYVRSCTLGSRR
jgi:uncharacterized protein (DUF4415 family)